MTQENGTKAAEEKMQPRSFTLPLADLRLLQNAANDEFNGNVSLAIRYALKKTYKIGNVDKRRLRHELL
jgi:hypothetical protein